MSINVTEYAAKVTTVLRSDHGITAGVQIDIENTGGGCEALVIRTAAGVVAVSEDDFGDMGSATVVWHAGNTFDDGEEYTAILADPAPAAVARLIAVVNDGPAAPTAEVSSLNIPGGFVNVNRAIADGLIPVLPERERGRTVTRIELSRAGLVWFTFDNGDEWPLRLR